MVTSLLGRGNGSRWETEVDPTVYVLSANVRRRHLTAEQKRQAIAAYITADPTASNRKVAKDLEVVSARTVDRVRSDQNAPESQNDHLPLERAKAALRTDPTLTQRQLKAAAKISTGTAVKARKELEAAGEIDPKERGSSQPPKPRAKPTTKAKAKGEIVAPGKLAVARLRKELIAFSEDQIGKLDEIDGASTDDIAEYVAAIDQVAAKLKAAANLLANVDNQEVQSK